MKNGNDPTEYYDIMASGSFGVEEGSTIIIDEAFMQVPGRAHRVDSEMAFWAVIDGVLLVFILAGNILTILAVRFSRRLRSVISNMFILSLAISDMVVGFTLPYHLAFYMGSTLGRSKGFCLLRFSLIILACCVSIWNLIAIAVDRYIAIVYPLHYSRYMTKKVALILLGFGWILGGTFAFILIFWNNWETAKECEFDEILPPWYMAGIITPGFSLVWVCMLIVYWRIWREASKHAKQLRSSFTGLQDVPSDWKSVQVVLIILGCFSICWLPYFIVACGQLFKFFEGNSHVLYKGAFSLAMANSGMNPIIYAWKNTSFRRAFARLLRCKSPDYIDASQHSARSNVHRKSSSLNHQDTLNVTITCSPPPHSAVSGNFDIEKAQKGYYIEGGEKINDSCKKKQLGTIHSVNASRSTSQNFDSPTSSPTQEIKACKDTVVFANGTIIKSERTPTLTPKTTEESISDEELLTTEPTLQDQGGGIHAVVIQKIACDGNGNTQIRIVTETNKSSDHNQCVFTRPKTAGLLVRLNSKSAEFPTVIVDETDNSTHTTRIKDDMFPISRHSMIEKHSTNGKLLVNQVENSGQRII